MKRNIVRYVIVMGGMVLLMLINFDREQCCSRAVALSAGDAQKPAAVAEKSKGVPSLIDLGRTFCIPCKMMAPILEELKKEYAGRLDVQFIDVGDNPEAAKKYQILMIPTQVFLDASGKELYRHVGFFSKEDILKKWKELGVELAVKQAK